MDQPLDAAAIELNHSAAKATTASGAKSHDPDQQAHQRIGARPEESESLTQACHRVGRHICSD
jgi:hypothetical protein